MKFRNYRTHIIDLIFPLALLFVFAASALLVLLLSANSYSRTTAQAQTEEERYTALSYLLEKIRQNDADGAISITTQDGVDCLTILAEYNGVRYATYIYEHDGVLKELFTQEASSFSPESGQTVTESYGLTMEEIKAGVFRFTAKDSEGKISTLIAAERSSS